MKMRTKYLKNVLVSLILAIVLSGCHHLSSVDNVLTTAYLAISREDLSAFSETLTGPAFAAYANEPAMRRLKSEFDKLRFEIGNEVLLSRVSCGEKCELKTYSVQILGYSKETSIEDAQLFRTAHIKCEVVYQHSTNTGHDEPLVTCKIFNFQ